jgi:hypothetical protein
LSHRKYKGTKVWDDILNRTSAGWIYWDRKSENSQESGDNRRIYSKPGAAEHFVKFSIGCLLPDSTAVCGIHKDSTKHLNIKKKKYSVFQNECILGFTKAKMSLVFC